MLYKGHLRRQVQDCRHLLGEILARDDGLSARQQPGQPLPLLVTADPEVRDAFETLLSRCQLALTL